MLNDWGLDAKAKHPVDKGIPFAHGHDVFGDGAGTEEDGNVGVGSLSTSAAYDSDCVGLFSVAAREQALAEERANDNSTVVVSGSVEPGESRVGVGMTTTHNGAFRWLRTNLRTFCHFTAGETLKRNREPRTYHDSAMEETMHPYSTNRRTRGARPERRLRRREWRAAQGPADEEAPAVDMVG